MGAGEGAPKKSAASLKGKKLILHASTDEVVKNPVSLYNRVRSNDMTDRGVSFEMALNPKLNNPHTRVYSRKEEDALIGFIDTPKETDSIRKIQPLPKPSNNTTGSMEDYMALLMVATFVTLLAYSHIRRNKKEL